MCLVVGIHITNIWQARSDAAHEELRSVRVFIQEEGQRHLQAEPGPGPVTWGTGRPNRNASVPTQRRPKRMPPGGNDQSSALPMIHTHFRSYSDRTRVDGASNCVSLDIPWYMASWGAKTVSMNML